MYWDEIFQIALSVFSNPYPAPVRFSAPAAAATHKRKKPAGRSAGSLAGVRAAAPRPKSASS
jgi:hypothetical protein